MVRDLSRLLNPKSIALFGGGWAENVIAQLKKSGYRGDIWPVHPRRDAIGGLACFKALDDLPAPPDVAFVGVNREASIEVIGELSRMGAGGATCFASGFRESDGEGSGGGALQDRLVEAAGEMPVLGPNCYGMLNYLDNVTIWPDQHGGKTVQSGVAIIGQSSNILINITMQKRALPIAYTVAVGNQAVIGISDLASAMLDDPRVTAIGLFIEGFDDIRKFEALATKAARLGKPIAAIKSGKSEASRASTLSHTASLAGSSIVSSAFLKRLGIIEVTSVAVLLETLKLLHGIGRLEGNSLSSVSCSGGEVGLVADMTSATNLRFPPLGPVAQKRLKNVLGPIVTISNPLDYHTFIWGDEDKMTEVYSAVFGEGYDLNLVVMDIPPADRCDPSTWESAIRSVLAARKSTKANVAQIATLPENLEEPVSVRLFAEGVVPLHGMEEAFAAIDAILSTGQIRNVLPELVHLPASSGGSETVLFEDGAKLALAAFGLVVPNSRTVKSPDELARIADDVSFPVALKALGIAHKSDLGAVALDLSNKDELLNAAQAMPGANGYLVEEMVTGVVAELIVGFTRDETGMGLLTIGTGGVLTELIGDSASLIVPASREDVRLALSALRIQTLLDGYRGKPAADKEAVVNAIMAVQAYCLATPGLVELDVNPLIACVDRCVAVDALIRLQGKED